jgi:hypothetical protein
MGKEVNSVHDLGGFGIDGLGDEHLKSQRRILFSGVRDEGLGEPLEILVDGTHVQKVAVQKVAVHKVAV